MVLLEEPDAAPQTRVERPQATNVIVIAVSIAIIMVDGYDLQSIGFVAPEMTRAWSLPMSSFAPVFAAGLAGTIPGAMLAGPIARLVGLRASLMLALLVFGVGTLGIAATRDITPLVSLRLLIGIGLGAAVPLVMTLVAKHTAVRLRSTMVVLALCGQPIGAILGAQLCARLIPAFGWQSAFILGGALPLLLIPLLLTLPASGPKEDPAAGAKGHIRELFEPVLMSTTLLLWLTTFLLVFATYVIVNWLPGIVRDRGFTLDASILAISLFNAGTIVGAITVGVLIDRFEAFKIMPAIALLAAASLLALDFTGGILAAFNGAALASGLFAGGASAAMGALTISLYPPVLRTTGAGWVFAVGRLGGAIGPLIIGAVLTAGLASARLFDLAALAAFFAAAALVLLGGVRRRAPAGATIV